MKKIISLALAAAMVAGMAVTSFAAEGDKVTKEIVFGNNDGSKAQIHEVTSDGVVKTQGATSVDPEEAVKPGSTFAIPVVVEKSTLAANPGPNDKPTVTYEKATKDDIKGWKVKATWEEKTGDIVESVKIENRKSDKPGTNNPSEKYDYYVIITTKKDAPSTTKNYLYGELAIYKTSVKNASSTFPYNYAMAGYDSLELVDGDKADSTVYAEGNGAPVRAFKNAGDEVIVFDEIGEYEINVAAQNKLYLAFNTKAVNDVIDAYDYANLDFVNFPGTPKFYRTGTFYLYADIEDEDKYLYKLVDGVVSEVDSVYDEDMGGFKFALKNFPNSFIISDVELDLEEVAVDVPTTEAPDAETPSKENPNTGR